MKFTTKDSDNDQSSFNCAQTFKGAWWYKSCYGSNLNGFYFSAGTSDSKGMRWGSTHMKKSEMKVRPGQS